MTKKGGEATHTRLHIQTQPKSVAVAVAEPVGSAAETRSLTHTLAWASWVLTTPTQSLHKRILLFDFTTMGRLAEMQRKLLEVCWSSSV